MTPALAFPPFALDRESSNDPFFRGVQQVFAHAEAGRVDECRAALSGARADASGANQEALVAWLEARFAPEPPASGTQRATSPWRDLGRDRLAKGFARARSTTQGSEYPVLIVGEDADGFSLDSAPPTWLDRKPALRLLLVHLARSHREEAGRWLSVSDLSSHLWPDDRTDIVFRTRRLYTLLSRLRSLGLARVLESSGDGRWRIAPEVDLVFVAAEIRAAR